MSTGVNSTVGVTYLSAYGPHGRTQMGQNTFTSRELKRSYIQRINKGAYIVAISTYFMSYSKLIIQHSESMSLLINIMKSVMRKKETY